jgi:hypothetical protein
VTPTRDRRNRRQTRRQTRTSRNLLASSRALLASASTLALLIALPCASAGAAESGASPASPAAAESAASPLPASDYTVRPVCAAPAPGYASCLALQLVPSTETARARTHPLGITRSQPIAAAGSEAAEGDFGLRPQDLHSVYQLPPTSSSAQTIAIVDAYNDLNAAADLDHYSNEFGLSELTTCTADETSDCFEKVNQNGEAGNLPFPASTEAKEAEETACKSKAVGKKAREAREAACKEVEAADGWATEISLDIEVSHAVCQNCKIALVEADSASFFDLETAEDTAAGLPATEISNSWGGAECSKGTGGPECGEDSEAFNHQGVVTTAAAGDDGYLDWDAEEGVEKGFADYPASSPHVVAVGGTRLSLGAEGEWAGETVWNGKGAGGGGCSISFAAPAWQTAESDWSSLGCGEGRAVADVSADADPYTGVAVYDSTPESPESSGEVGWTTIGGTSLASPLVASVFALAGGAHGVKYPAETLYENELKLPNSLHDVTKGSNGECSKLFDKETGLSGCTELEEAATCSEKPAICQARIGYDGPSGVGTPDGIVAFKPSGEEGKQQTEKQREEEKLHEEQLHEEEQKKQTVGASGSGSNGNGSSTGGSSTSASGHSEAGAGTGQTSGPSVGKASEAAGSAAASGMTTIRLSALALTPNALLSLRSVKPKIRAVGFAFTLSADARVHATLAKRVRVHGHMRWVTLAGSLTIAAAKGRNHGRLTGHNALAPGRYRLTLTPQGGAARSIVFQIG